MWIRLELPPSTAQPWTNLTSDAVLPAETRQPQPLRHERRPCPPVEHARPREDAAQWPDLAAARCPPHHPAMNALAAADARGASRDAPPGTPPFMHARTPPGGPSFLPAGPAVGRWPAPADAPADAPPAPRRCAACQRVLAAAEFSKMQWAMGDAVSRCCRCICRRGSGTMRYPVSMRNASSRAAFPADTLLQPFAEGAFRLVGLGRYTEGVRFGELCVAKWFKPKYQVLEPHAERLFQSDLKTVKMSLRILREWNPRWAVRDNKTIQMTAPEIWTLGAGAPPGWEGRKVLQEPFINGFLKWNSNTGWCLVDTQWARIMQALSHFSYHITGGQMVLCDLQGGLCATGAVLTDPVILSVGEKFGLTDLGQDGIRSFFAQHECNEFCRSSWILPRSRRVHYPAERSTKRCFAPVVNSRALTRSYM